MALPGRNFTNGFVKSWTNLVAEFYQKGWGFYLSNYRAADMHNCRNRIVLYGGEPKGENTQPFNGVDYDYALWIDSDMIFNFWDLEKLIEADKDIIGGMYPLNGAGTSTTGWFKGDGNHRANYDYFKDLSEPFEIDYIGFGFLLVKKGVFEKIGYPWFQAEEVGFGDKGVSVHASEDVAFARKAQRKGFKLWAHPQVRLDHQKPVTLTFGKSGQEENNNGDGSATQTDNG